MLYHLRLWLYNVTGTNKAFGTAIHWLSRMPYLLKFTYIQYIRNQILIICNDGSKGGISLGYKLPGEFRTESVL